MPRRPPRVLSIDDDRIVVAGTRTVEQARELVVAAGAGCTCEPTVFTVHSCTPRRGYVRWFRDIPANWPDPCGHERHLIDARRGERGAFVAVVFG
jgi:hypothetical protein